jgi:uncharacterized membrane protein YccC
MIGKLLATFAGPVIAGILVGVAVVWFVEPTTDGGTALLVTISVLLSIAVYWVARFIARLVTAGRRS